MPEGAATEAAKKPSDPDLSPDLPSSLVRGVPLEEGPPHGTLTLGGFLTEVTERFAGREALVFHEGEEVIRWSYVDLQDQATDVARSLLALGAVKGARVGVLMTNRPEFIAAVFGIALAGGIAVPLSTFSTADELAYLLDTSAISILLYERSVARKDFTEILLELEPQFGSASPGELQSTRFPYLRYGAVIGDAVAGSAVESWSAFLGRGRAVAPELVEACSATVCPGDPAAIFFSSGTTAQPKGMLNAHRAIVLQFSRQAWLLDLRTDDVRAWAANGFFWSGNFALVLGSTLWVGGSLVLQRTFDPDEALRLFEMEKVTHPQAWPHQWGQLEASPLWDGIDLSAMRYVDPSNPIAHHPTVSADWRAPFWSYGSSETFTVNTGYPGSTPVSVAGGTHGLPLPGNSLKIVDPRSSETLLRGERGEICIKGPTLMLGYVGIPLDETVDEEGFFRTGDGGYVDAQGRLVWEGRLTEIIKTGGANVSPLEVDEALMQHPDVKAAKTIGLPHDTLGEIVVSCVVLHDAPDVTESDVITFLKQKIASYKVPRKIVFLDEEELALTGTSKIKSDKLKQIALEKMAA